MPCQNSDRPKTNTTRTLEVSPNLGEMVKPAELIEFKGASRLTLADRRLFNVLLQQLPSGLTWRPRTGALRYR